MRISDWSSDVCSSDLKQAKRVQAQSGDTFRAVAEEYVSKLTQEGRAEATLTKLEWLLSFAYPKLGRRPIRDITVPEVLEVLRRVEARGRYETARRLRSTIGSVFRYAMATARAEADPTIALKGALIAPSVRSHAAITTPTALGGLLRAIDAYDGQPSRSEGHTYELQSLMRSSYAVFCLKKKT